MAGLPFEKWHGLGNDFVVVRQSALDPLVDGRDFMAWCDRHTGIGADGVLVVSDEAEASFSMSVTNRDGSTPEICGNGVRCAVLSWAAGRGLERGAVTVGTGAGPKRCRFDQGTVTVEMGPATFVDGDLPTGGDHQQPARASATVAGVSVVGWAVSMGNPHLVLFGADWAALDPSAAAPLEHHPGFPRRVNVSFAAEPVEGRIDLQVWERGVGFTQACGSAACATAVAAVATRRGGLRPSDRIDIALPGGDLVVTVSDDFQSVQMTGPAVRVFTGVLSTSAELRS